jgi:hypothetical protein
MTDSIFDSNKLRREIVTAENQIQSLKDRLSRIERSCSHSWGPIQYAPINHSGYQIAGDPPGTMGVDWQGPMWVPSSTTKLWTRTCKVCGKTETTQRTKKEHIAGSIPGTCGEAEVPDFGRW